MITNHSKSLLCEELFSYQQLSKEQIKEGVY